uniref:Uncharacterized protein n=1 Tax=Utricularia reniformis TaxID=192314 RepID=A0A1Y0B2L3_9LAMI|nr:hypothetical protein AEK19_MT1494 [Utricularia reniformis]ART31685.1 hypothetical protein AEK19_MT1494 [Utricularia reniformis]
MRIQIGSPVALYSNGGFRSLSIPFTASLSAHPCPETSAGCKSKSCPVPRNNRNNQERRQAQEKG